MKSGILAVARSRSLIAAARRLKVSAGNTAGFSVRAQFRNGAPRPMGAAALAETRNLDKARNLNLARRPR
jgi:hypothetical protein